MCCSCRAAAHGACSKNYRRLITTLSSGQCPSLAGTSGSADEDVDYGQTAGWITDDVMADDDDSQLTGVDSSSRLKWLWQTTTDRRHRRQSSTTSLSTSSASTTDCEQSVTVTTSRHAGREISSSVRDYIVFFLSKFKIHVLPFFELTCQKTQKTLGLSQFQNDYFTDLSCHSSSLRTRSNR